MVVSFAMHLSWQALHTFPLPNQSWFRVQNEPDDIKFQPLLSDDISAIIDNVRN